MTRTQPKRTSRTGQDRTVGAEQRVSVLVTPSAVATEALSERVDATTTTVEQGP